MNNKDILNSIEQSLDNLLTMFSNKMAHHSAMEGSHGYNKKFAPNTDLLCDILQCREKGRFVTLRHLIQEIESAMEEILWEYSHAIRRNDDNAQRACDKLLAFAKKELKTIRDGRKALME